MNRNYLFSLLLALSSGMHGYKKAVATENMNPTQRIKLLNTELKDDFHDIKHIIKKIEQIGSKLPLDQNLAEKVALWQSFKKHVSEAAKDLTQMSKIQKGQKSSK